jgi:DNA-binding MarR family transcriptional regulator
MSDVKFGGTSPDTITLYPSDAALKQGLDLLFIAARDIPAQGANPLAKARLGHAHAQALHFIARKPELCIAELLGFLKVTKQSLNRVLNGLPKNGVVERKTGMQDRRTRRLQVTATAQDAVNGFCRVHMGLCGVDGRRKGTA